MSNIFDMFETDPELERDGVTLEYGINSKGEPIQIVIARAGGSNIAFLKRLEQLTKPYRRLLDAGHSLPKELNDKLQRELYADTVIKDMRGFEERDGTPIPFTKEAVINLFERLPNLFIDVMSQAQALSTFRSEQREAEAKN